MRRFDYALLVLILLLSNNPARAFSVDIPVRDIMAGAVMAGFMTYSTYTIEKVRPYIPLAYQTADEMLSYSRKHK